MQMRRGLIATIAAGAGLAVLVVIGLLAAHGDAAPAYRTEVLTVAGTPEAAGAPVRLDATIYLPARRPAPAVLLAHGYGGSKQSVAPDAVALVRRGYVVLAYSARGFGHSGGLDHLDSPDYEVPDAARMLDLLARRPEVLQDGPGDPRVGVVGGSYGGALALLLAGTDHRVDAVVPSITWNNLQQALFPQFVTQGPQVTPAGLTPSGGLGVFKRQWTSLLFGASAFAGPTAGSATSATATSGPASPSGGDPTQGEASGGGSGSLGQATLQTACGRLALDLCLGYQQVATTGTPSPELLKLLAASSPATVDHRITAPTLLIQGQSDSLFPLGEGDANATAIASAGTEVRVFWEAGGHDGTTDEERSRLGTVTADFLDGVLGRPPGSTAPGGWSSSALPGFRVSVPDAVLSSTDTNPAPQERSAGSFPGLRAAPGRPAAGDQASGGQASGGQASGDQPTGDVDPGFTGASAPVSLLRLPLQGGAQLAIAPPGGSPAALTSLPGAGSALSLLGAAGGASGATGSATDTTGSGSAGSIGLGVLPGQAAQFETPPLAKGLTVTGSSRVTLRISSTTHDATLFASLLDIAPDGSSTLPRQLVSPIRLTGLGQRGQSRQVTIALPAVVRDVPAGHRLRVVVSSTDQGYALPLDPRGYRIALAEPTLSVPQVPLRTDPNGSSRALWLAAGLIGVGTLLIVAGFGLYHRRVRRRTVGAAVAELAQVPLDLRGLGKAYGDGFRAVTDLSFRVETGQVLGLLGPNGAGKTTTLRMLMGLILPSEGEIRIFGHRVTPGAPVLSRLGSFIEGPGFLPHLSGRQNLDLYWRSTGRPPADSGIEDALQIAALGEGVHRKVRTYSQGMRQRLAIAQAMLGRPDLLVLDEPTNGLDPPQILQMREVLRRYAATGRTVLVSSHLLSEVEQTCTHLVVMAGGRLVAQGPVGELVAGSTSTVIGVDDPAAAATVAAAVPGVDGVEVTAGGLVVHAGPDARSQLLRALVEAGLRVDRIAPQRGLEETFLALVAGAAR